MMGNARLRFNWPTLTIRRNYRMTEQTSKTPDLAEDKPLRTLPEAARRALEEAEIRRQKYREEEAARPKEIGGRGGKEPGRYGDWEVKGLTSDF
jgi:hypothetical protein